MNRDAEAMEEFREDMKREAYEDDCHEEKMHSDEEYALSQLSPEMVKDAVALLKLTVKTMAKYGHQISYSDLMDIS